MKRLIVAAFALLAGCSLPIAPQSADITHTLALAPQASIPLAVPVEQTLQVMAPGAAPGYATTAIAYRQSAYELRYYARQRWIDRPARLLGQALVDGLSAGGARVLPEGGGMRADYRLLSQLLQIEQDFTTRPSRMRLALRVQLVDVRDGRLLGGQTLRLEQAAGSDDAAGGVAAANALLLRAVVETAQLCQRLTAAEGSAE